MPSPPLSEAFAAILKTDATAALGALMVIANAHKEVFAWTVRMIGAEPSPKLNGNGADPHRAKRPRRLKPRGNVYLAGRRARRDADDLALVEALRTSPDATIPEWAATIGKSKSSVVSALKRLEEAGSVEHDRGRWRVAGPKEPPPRWTKPLSGAERAHQVHLTA
jgi:hypothetical protein